ncbi:hypothetical protein SAMN04487788_2317 [Microbacterium testaceum StLB037]|uniref:Uncharacterized protein n=1 Tax=Microbacterium testaceum (strain StLB037) TaxID=979556 RepID=A0A1H0QBJ2_MICTS|nr:hypothetical protein [Microbacterium testaceum]SDP14038.1 hypothetical protein SAMN04487788_2317 [Microbacterium testaceum StLB037]
MSFTNSLRSSRLVAAAVPVALAVGAALTVIPAVSAAVAPVTVQAEVVHYRPSLPIANGPSIHY